MNPLDTSDNELISNVYNGINLRGIAEEEFIEKIPDNPYDLCPCGCGKKWRYVSTDEKTLEDHQKAFIDKWIKNYKESHQISSNPV